MARLALEARRRVKEQQKPCLKSEFRNTHFSYTMGSEGVEQFVATPELHSDEAIDGDPLPPALRESAKVGEQNLYTRAKDLIGDRDPRAHE